MVLVRIERDCTGPEASQFVADLAVRLVAVVDLSGILGDIQDTMDVDGDDLRGILVDRFAQFAQGEDEEILDWVITYLAD